MSGQWNELFAPGSFSCDTMLLLTDGTVLVHDAGGAEGGADWLRLAPDGQGIYLNGTWSKPLTMANSRVAFASGVLTDGRVFVVGGEYSSAGHDTPLGEIFTPATGSTGAWAPMTSKIPLFNYIQGDAPSCVLADGRVLFGNVGQVNSGGTPYKTAIWDPSTDVWNFTECARQDSNPRPAA
jgi:hypothetical protein